MSPDLVRAGRLVEARLGRPPQDALEAAVVLEAWAGVPAQQALETARALMPTRAEAPLASRAAPAAPVRSQCGWFEGLAFVATIAAIALWAAPLADALGADVVRDALRLALPLSLCLQWALACRHLGRPSGLAGLVDRRAPLAVGGVALVCVPALALGQPGALAGLLVVTWTAGTILIHRGWTGAYCALVLAAVPALFSDLPATWVFAFVAVVIAALAWWALRTATPAAAVPGRWSRTAAAALIGAGMGGLLVADPTVSWTGTAAPALALLPSALGALWAGRHLWTLAGTIPHALAGVPASGRPAGSGASHEPPRGSCGVGRRHGRVSATGPLRAVRGLRSDRRDVVAAPPRGGTLAPARALAGAVARLVALTFAGSVVLGLLMPWPSGAAGALAGYGVIALAMLLAGVVDALGQPSLAVAGVGGGLAVAVLLDPPFAGAGLLCGGSVAVAVLAPAALILLLRPARTLATTLWIT